MIIELDQYKYELGQKEQALRDLGASLDLENKKKRIAELDRMMEEPDFLDRSGKGQPVLHRGPSSEGRGQKLRRARMKTDSISRDGTSRSRPAV